MFRTRPRKFPPSDITCRGEPFWNRHQAKLSLREDVKSGVATSMLPSQLRGFRPEYKEFKEVTFAKHVHQEKSKQRAAPYWQVKCQKICRRQRDIQLEELKSAWMQSNIEEGDGEEQDTKEIEYDYA